MANPKNDENRGNPGAGNQSDTDKGDNRSNVDHDGNRGPRGGKPQGGEEPDSRRNPSVGEDDADRSNRDRGDGRRGGDEGGVS